MRRKTAVLIALMVAFFSSSAHAGEDVISMESPRGVEETADRLEKVLREKGMTVFIRIDHDKNAEKAGLELRPTKLFIFGNPKVGTQLMRCNQEAAIDLPQKALVWENGAGKVWLSYNDPSFIAEKYEMTGEGCEEIVSKIGQALREIAYETIAP